MNRDQYLSKRQRLYHDPRASGAIAVAGGHTERRQHARETVEAKLPPADLHPHDRVHSYAGFHSADVPAA